MSTLTSAWKEHLDKVRQMQKLAMELFCHPDATAEQLATVHLVMSELMQKHRELVPKVRAKWPRYKSFVDLEDITT